MSDKTGNERKSLQDLTDLNGYTQAEIFPMYANFIISEGLISEQIVRVNRMIIDRWGNAALILIKDKAWRIVHKVPKYKKIASYLLSTEP